MPTQRIQKVLAGAGFGARRACEDLVVNGHVAVNGKTVRTLPVMVDPAKDHIAVKGRPVRSEKTVYYLLNKPRRVYCTHDDPAGRQRAVDLMVGVRERVFPVGRLDASSTGLLIMTNDGALTQKLTHPRFGIPKTYRAEVEGCPTDRALEKLRSGTWLAEGKTAPARITIIHKQRDKAILEITLREGRNREIRRMLAKAGHKVRRLTRICVGKLSIKAVPLGSFRPLTASEVAYLKALADRTPDDQPSPRRSRPRPTRRPRAAGPKPKTAAASPKRDKVEKPSAKKPSVRKSSPKKKQTAKTKPKPRDRATSTKKSTAKPTRRRRMLLPD